MTIPEQAGKVASSAIDALRGNPGLLVLVLLQIATLGVLYVANSANQQRLHERELLLLRSCLHPIPEDTRR